MSFSGAHPELAAALRALIEQGLGLRVWRHEVAGTSTDHVDGYDVKIRAAIAECKAFVLLASPDWERTYCSHELGICFGLPGSRTLVVLCTHPRLSVDLNKRVPGTALKDATDPAVLEALADTLIRNEPNCRRTAQWSPLKDAFLAKLGDLRGEERDEQQIDLLTSLLDELFSTSELEEFVRSRYPNLTIPQNNGAEVYREAAESLLGARVVNSRFFRNLVVSKPAHRDRVLQEENNLSDRSSLHLLDAEGTYRALTRIMPADVRGLTAAILLMREWIDDRDISSSMDVYLARFPVARRADFERCRILRPDSEGSDPLLVSTDAVNYLYATLGDLQDDRVDHIMLRCHRLTVASTSEVTSRAFTGDLIKPIPADLHDELRRHQSVYLGNDPIRKAWWETATSNFHDRRTTFRRLALLALLIGASFSVAMVLAYAGVDERGLATDDELQATEPVRYILQAILLVGCAVALLVGRRRFRKSRFLLYMSSGFGALAALYGGMAVRALIPELSALLGELPAPRSAFDDFVRGSWDMLESALSLTSSYIFLGAAILLWQHPDPPDPLAAFGVGGARKWGLDRVGNVVWLASMPMFILVSILTLVHPLNVPSLYIRTFDVVMACMACILLGEFLTRLSTPSGEIPRELAWAARLFYWLWGLLQLPYIAEDRDFWNAWVEAVYFVSLMCVKPTCVLLALLISERTLSRRAPLRLDAGPI